MNQFGGLLHRSNSCFVAESSPDKVIERQLVVLFGLIHNFKQQCDNRYFWDAVNRGWLQVKIMEKGMRNHTRELVEAVLESRKVAVLHTSTALPAKTHLGRLVDDWADHGLFYFNPLGWRITTLQDGRDLSALEKTTSEAFRRKPLYVFSINDKKEMKIRLLEEQLRLLRDKSVRYFKKFGPEDRLRVVVEEIHDLESAFE
ncbi:hypothetical protein PG987_012519 [Apiospora arundinis]